jgi:hypothetical protein
VTDHHRRRNKTLWLEVKILFSVIAMVFIAIVLSQIFLYMDMMLSFLLLMSIGMITIGDMMIGSRIKHNHVDKLIDTPPKGKEFAAILTLTGLLDFIWVDKKPYGKREFMYHGQEASFFNRGDSQIHTLNGNIGCLAHEDHDENINLNESKAAESISKDFHSDDIKDVYYKAKEFEKQTGVKLIGVR